MQLYDKSKVFQTASVFFEVSTHADKLETSGPIGPLEALLPALL